MLNNAFSKHSLVWEHCPLTFQEDLGPLFVVSRAVFAMAAEEDPKFINLFFQESSFTSFGPERRE